MSAAAHTQKWKILDLFAALHILCGLLLEGLLPLPFKVLLGPFRMATIVVGIACLVASVLGIAAARRELRRRSQPTDPGIPTTELIVSGVFAFSRNPLSLGTLLFLLGLGLLLVNFWMVILLVPTAVFIKAVLIAPEERYLRRSFGKDYEAYCSKVPRWI